MFPSACAFSDIVAVMFGDGSLTFREFAMKEPLPLATIHDAVIDFLRNRDDAVLFGAQAVNAYVDEPRMTQDVDILSTRAPELAEEIRSHLARTFTIAARVREVAAFPPTQIISDVRVPTPEELIAQKVISLTTRSAQPKGDTDRRDLKVLLLAYPHLKSSSGPVRDRLAAASAGQDALTEWEALVAMNIQPESDADEFE